MKIKTLALLVMVNFKNFFREPGALFWSFAFPIAMAWVLGVAFSGTPEKKYKIFIAGDSTLKKIYPLEKGNDFTKEIGGGTGMSVRANFINASSEEINDALKKGTCILYVALQKGE